MVSLENPTICVFCASASGNQPGFAQAAREVGAQIARSGRRLVYGGGKVGLMGAVADGALAAGGEVIGVMPRALVEREIAHQGLTRLHIVDSMHARKVLLSESASAFLALPGGAGTLEEIIEQWTWAQLGLHAKPVGFLNIDRFYDPLFTMIDRMVENGFLAARYRAALILEEQVDTLLSRFESYIPPQRKSYDLDPPAAPLS